MNEQVNEPVTIIAVGDVMMQNRPRQPDIEAVHALLARPGMVLANIDRSSNEARRH